MSGTTQFDFEANQGGTPSPNAPRHGRYVLQHPSPLPIEDHLLQHFTHTEWALIRLQTVETAFLNRIYQAQVSPFTTQIAALDAPTRLGIGSPASRPIEPDSSRPSGPSANSPPPPQLFFTAKRPPATPKSLIPWRSTPKRVY